MMVRLMICVVAVLALIGCKAGSPAEIANRTGDKLLLTPNSELVTAYSYQRMLPSLSGEKRAKLRAEIDRRKLFDADQWRMIEEKKIAIGQPEFLVWCAWGPPDRVGNYQDAAGQSRSLWYDRSQTTVYTDGQKVTGILD